MEPRETGSINISPSRHVRVVSSGDSEATSCSSSSLATTDGSHTLSSSTPSECGWTFPPLASPPTTPRSPLPPSRLHHRFTSHDQLSTAARAHKRDWDSTTDGFQDAEDKFTQLPVPSSRERRSSSVTLSSHHSARGRRSFANLRKSLVLHNSSDINEELSNTPKRHSTPHSIPQLGSIEGPRLSRKYIEASRRSAREALEEDLRVLEEDSGKSDEFVLDCYFTSLDYMIKALKTDGHERLDLKTRRSIRARLQTLSDTLLTPEEIAVERAQSYTASTKEFHGQPNDRLDRCSCVVTAALDYIIIIFNVLASSLLALIVYIVDLVASDENEGSKVKATESEARRQAGTITVAQT